MKRKLIHITAKSRTQIHVGTQRRMDDVSDSLFRRDSQGNLIIPGTSIAGAIRSHLTRIVAAITPDALRKTTCDALKDSQDINEKQACGCVICELMGDIRPLNTFVTGANRSKENGRASRLIVSDAHIDTSTHTYIRDGVGIDRVTGTASRAGAVKFDYETIPVGVKVQFYFELEDANDMDLYLVGLALSEWKAGRIRFGGNVNRGLGSLSLEQTEESSFDLCLPQDLMRWLRREEAYTATKISSPVRAGYLDRYAAVPHSLQCWIQIDFNLHGVGFFLSNDTTTAMSNQRDHYALGFLPGSSLRGVIRNQAERIARTIANLNANGEDDFLQRCAAADPFVTSESQHTTGLISAVSRIAGSHLLSDEMKESPGQELFDLSERLFGTTRFGSRLVVEDASLLGKPDYKPIDFVAIDRFTGGAADHAKFDACALWKPVFACRLFLESPQTWEIGWLMHVLHDLHAGRITVGFGGAKGFGEVRITHPDLKTLDMETETPANMTLKVAIGYTHPEAAVSALGVQADTITNSFFVERLLAEDELTAMVNYWMIECSNTISDFRVDTHVPHQPMSDPYWSDPTILHLYAKETNINAYFPDHH